MSINSFLSCISSQKSKEKSNNTSKISNNNQLEVLDYYDNNKLLIGSSVKIDFADKQKTIDTKSTLIFIPSEKDNKKYVNLKKFEYQINKKSLLDDDEIGNNLNDNCGNILDRSLNEYKECLYTNNESDIDEDEDDEKKKIKSERTYSLNKDLNIINDNNDLNVTNTYTYTYNYTPKINKNKSFLNKKIKKQEEKFEDLTYYYNENDDNDKNTNTSKLSIIEQLLNKLTLLQKENILLKKKSQSYKKGIIRLFNDNKILYSKISEEQMKNETFIREKTFLVGIIRKLNLLNQGFNQNSNNKRRFLYEEFISKSIFFERRIKREGKKVENNENNEKDEKNEGKVSKRLQYEYTKEIDFIIEKNNKNLLIKYEKADEMSIYIRNSYSNSSQSKDYMNRVKNNIDNDILIDNKLKLRNKNEVISEIALEIRNQLFNYSCINSYTNQSQYSQYSQYTINHQLSSKSKSKPSLKKSNFQINIKNSYDNIGNDISVANKKIKLNSHSNSNSFLTFFNKNHEKNEDFSTKNMKNEGNQSNLLKIEKYILPLESNDKNTNQKKVFKSNNDKNLKSDLCFKSKSQSEFGINFVDETRENKYYNHNSSLENENNNDLKINDIDEKNDETLSFSLKKSSFQIKKEQLKTKLSSSSVLKDIITNKEKRILSSKHRLSSFKSFSNVSNINTTGNIRVSTSVSTNNLIVGGEMIINNNRIYINDYSKK